jgi:hypothetical protein
MPVTKKAASAKAEPAKTKTASKSITVPATATAGSSARPVAAAKPGNGSTPRRSSATKAVDPERRRNYVEVAAYYIAERRGFSAGDQTNDWLAAEQEIDRLLRENKLSA